MEVGDKKLLVLHLKGFLIDCYHDSKWCPNFRPDGKANRFHVYRRAGCEEFVKFCLQNFVVGIWSSAHGHNVQELTNFVFGRERSKLAFVWSLDQCTESGRQHPDNVLKPLVWKELSVLWERKFGLPWKKGAFGPSNTVLVDDDNYTTQKNPPHTAIVLKTYRVTDRDDDNYLGKLQKYLGELACAEDVRDFIEWNPFRSSGPLSIEESKTRSKTDGQCPLVAALRSSISPSEDDSLGEVCDDSLSLEFSNALSIKDNPGIRKTDSVSSGKYLHNPLGTLSSTIHNSGEGGAKKAGKEKVASPPTKINSADSEQSEVKPLKTTEDDKINAAAFSSGSSGK